MTSPPVRRPLLPLILGGLAALAVLLVIGPFAAAVALLRSGPEMAGSDPAAKIVVGLVVIALAGLAGLIVYGAARLVQRLFRRAP